jgi:hypothetical protein
MLALILSLTFFSDLEVGEAVQAPSRKALPVVVITDRKPTKLEQLLPEARVREEWYRQLPPRSEIPAAADVYRQAVASGFVVEEFEGFQLFYRPSIFNLKQAEDQMKVLEYCIQQQVAGMQAFNVADWPKEHQATLRAMFPPGAEHLANLPSLRLSPGLETRMELSSGSRTATMRLPPKSPGMKGMDDVATPYGNASLYQNPVEETLPEELGHTMSILFPSDRQDWLLRMHWTKKIQDFFLEKCAEVKQQYQLLSSQLVQELMKKDEGRYGPGAVTPESFHSLSSKDQGEAMQLFKMEHRWAFANGDPESFVNNARVSQSSTTLTFSAYFIKERHENHIGVMPMYIHFRCPISP